VDFLLYGIVLLVLGLLYFFIDSARGLFLPGIRRMAKNERKKDQLPPMGSRLETWVKSSLPAKTYENIELFLARNGQGSEWTVGKFARNLIGATLLGIVVCFLLILIYFTMDNANPLLIIIGLLSLVLYPLFPIFMFRAGRSDFLAKIILQTPEFLDILDAELVRGSGNIETAIFDAAHDMEGELKVLLRKVQRLLQKEPGNLDGMCKMIENHVAHPLYDQITLMFRQYNITGKAKSNIESLQKTCRIEIQGLHRSQTRQKTTLISVVAIGIIGNLAILVLLPIVGRMMDFQYFFL